jgi:hypothetical protein
LIWGARNIARELNCGVRKAFYLLEKGLIPGDKVGTQWTARGSKLRAMG